METDDMVPVANVGARSPVEWHSTPRATHLSHSMMTSSVTQIVTSTKHMLKREHRAYDSSLELLSLLSLSLSLLLLLPSSSSSSSSPCDELLSSEPLEFAATSPNPLPAAARVVTPEARPVSLVLQAPAVPCFS